MLSFNFKIYIRVLGESGVRRSDIVNQYLKDIESEIETEEELAERKLLVDKVLDRLITHVCVCFFVFCFFSFGTTK